MDRLIFSRDKAAQLLESLIKQSPTIHLENASRNDLLQLAAAAIVMSSFATDVDSSAPFEWREASVQRSYDDAFTEVEFYADLTLLEQQHNYDQQFEPMVEARLVRDGDNRAIQIQKGSKQQ